MSFTDNGTMWGFIKTNTIICVVILSPQLQGFSHSAHAAIFDELRNGSLIQRDGGASEDAPPTGIRNGNYMPAIDPAEKQSASTATSRVIRKQMILLPSPRAMSLQLTSEQRRMRLLASRIGLAFAARPAVKLARLDEAEFVDLFTMMIHRESGFNRMAVSPAGARGLGQLMPGTAADLGVCDVFSAEENLQGAATYLTDMLEQFGTPELALAAYNAGPAAVTKYGGIPPYRETRQYVADILHAADLAPRMMPQASTFDIARNVSTGSRANGSSDTIIGCRRTPNKSTRASVQE